MKSLKDLSINNIEVYEKLLSTISSMKIEELVIGVSDLKYYLNIFHRKFNYSMTNDVVNDVLEQRVIPILSKENKLPYFFPFWLTMVDNRVVAIVNLSVASNSIKWNKNGEFEADERVLYSLLQIGSIALKSNDIFNNSKGLNLNLAKSMAEAYSRMLGFVVNTTYSIAQYPELDAKFHYAAYKFALINMLEMNIDNVSDIARKAMRRFKVRNEIFDYVDDLYVDGDFDNLKKFINKTSYLDNLLDNIILRIVQRNWFKAYGSMAFYALESPMYLMIVLGASIVGGTNLVKGYKIEDVTRKTSIDAYEAFARV